MGNLNLRAWSKKRVFAFLDLTYKTERAKKTALTKWIKEEKERLSDLQSIFKKDKGKAHSFYLGDRFFGHDIQEAKRQVKILEEARAELDAKR